MKKIAVKGLVTLAVVVALCMFFSGTIKTIATAKVKLVTAKQGKLEEQIKLSGKLVFPETEDVTLKLTGADSVVIKRVRVTRGRQIKEGDVLFEAEISGYDATMKTLNQELGDAQTELLELERKNGELRLKRTEELWVEAYDTLAQARNAKLEAKTALEVAARLAGVALENGRLPEKETDENLVTCQHVLDDAAQAEQEAQNRFNSANRLGISEDVIAYLTKSRELQKKIDETQEKIAALTVLAQTVGTVTAPHDGYVVEVNVKAGDAYDGRSAAIVISAKGSDGVLRADTSDIERSIEKNTQVSISRSNGKQVSKKVTGNGVNEEGKRYVDVEVSDKDISNLGGAVSLMDSAIEMVANYRASKSTTLLPVSAVRGSGDNRYVYTVNESSNALGETTLTVSKMDVKVLTEVGGTVSIEQELGRQRIAYMEDRAISEGSEVMTYAD